LILIDMSGISERILLTLWVGGMWTVGYIVAPTLFTTLEDRMLAGKLAGQLFTIMSYIGIVASLVLLTSQVIQSSQRRLQNWRVWVIGCMLFIILVGQFILQPIMAELKQNGIIESSIEAQKFARMHGLASVLFLINSLLGLVLVVFGLHKKPFVGQMAV
jgi:uncharacterized membrane protein